MTKDITLKVKGMHCAACELVLEKEISELSEVKKVDAKLLNNSIQLQITDKTNIDTLKEKINSRIGEFGYSVDEQNDKEDESRHTNSNKFKPFSRKDIRDYITAFAIAIMVIALFFGIQSTGIAENYGAAEINLAFIFFIGIIASISTCMAVVGSLVLSISSGYAKSSTNQFQATRALIVFHLSRLAAFFVLGGVIGLIGSAFTLTMQTTLIINIVLFTVLILMGLNLLGFEVAAKFLPRMPKAIVKSQLGNKRANLVTPVILGAITFFLPCGFTQSMQIFSLGTGSFINGAVTMFVFALGTFPVLALISFASVKLSKTLQSSVFFKTAGTIVILFALYNLYSSFVAGGIL